MTLRRILTLPESIAPTTMTIGYNDAHTNRIGMGCPFGEEDQRGPLVCYCTCHREGALPGEPHDWLCCLPTMARPATPEEDFYHELALREHAHRVADLVMAAMAGGQPFEPFAQPWIGPWKREP